jgi:hypothetical protein
MTRIHVVKQSDGWRVAIENGRQTVVLDNVYEHEQDAIVEAASLL